MRLWFPNWTQFKRGRPINGSPSKGAVVNLPKILCKEHRAPVILAVILTFVGWNAFGFGWFGLPSLGFVTSGGAEQLAVAKMEKVAVPHAAQLCAIRFNEQSPAIVAVKQATMNLSYTGFIASWNACLSTSVTCAPAALTTASDFSSRSSHSLRM